MATWNDVRAFVDTGKEIPAIPEGAELYPVVGVSFVEGYPGNIKALIQGSCVTLIRNPENKFDSNAIEVRSNGVMLGHLAKEVAAEFAPNMDDGAVYEATVYQVRISPESPNNPGLDILVEKL